MNNGKNYKWLVNRTNPEYINYISRLASVSPIFAQVLVNRGIKTSQQIDEFLNPDVSNLSDPFELPHMQAAIERIKRAKKNNERVMVHGDYDADGVSATAIMTEGLRKLGIDAMYFIPHRTQHGYGFGEVGLARARDAGAKLIITVDCGITSFAAAAEANANGIDVIITDHHEPAKQSANSGQQSVVKGEFLVPDAISIINPKLLTHNSSLMTLSGAGVAFMLIYALFDKRIEDVYEFFDLAATGTSADVVPLTGDNRVIMREGIKLIQSGQRRGVRALKDAARLRSDFFKTSFLYFVINPRINAAGRMADANGVVNLLTTRSDAEAEELANWLN
ncbi:MAG: DHH family phosphoesterase, partial [Nitrospirae bacterium]|nr:DHH family phosphoesterase [Nitrospirota bacterium]